MLRFLRESKSSLTHGSASCNAAKRRFVVVLGNESCDLDSACSSLAFAYLRFLDLHLSEEALSTSAVPVLNIPRSEFRLHTEVRFYLRKLLGPQVEECLVFINEIPLQTLAKEGRLELVLVDHNRLAPSQQKYANCIGSIIDHHVPSAPFGKRCEVNIELVGSCATLIAKKIISESPQLLQLDHTLSLMLYGAILIDTHNLSEQAGKVTPQDREATAFLERALQLDQPFRDELFREIQTAKADISDFEVSEALLKDYKQTSYLCSSVGFSSIPRSFQELSSKSESEHQFEEQLHEFCLMRKLSALVILFSFYDTDSVLRKQLMVFSVDGDLRSQIVLRLQNCCWNQQLIFQSQCVVFYEIRNVTVSRKQVLPVVQEALESYHGTANCSCDTEKLCRKREPLCISV